MIAVRARLRLITSIVTHMGDMGVALGNHVAEIFPTTAGCPHPVATAARAVVRDLRVLASALVAAERGLPHG